MCVLAFENLDSLLSPSDQFRFFIAFIDLFYHLCALGGSGPLCRPKLLQEFPSHRFVICLLISMLSFTVIQVKSQLLCSPIPCIGDHVVLIQGSGHCEAIVT
jgi:hypothetical protein